MFRELKLLVSARFHEMMKHPLFFTESDKDAIWEAYLGGFPEELRNEHNCNACKSFIRTIGTAVNINPVTLGLETVWDLENVPDIYRKSVEAVGAYVRGLKVSGLFHHYQTHAGVNRNADKVRGVTWEHFFVMLPSTLTNLHAQSAKLFETKTMLLRALDEINMNAIETVLELIEQGTIYMGNQNKDRLLQFQTLKVNFATVPDLRKDNFCWLNAAGSPPAVTRIRNDAFGTILVSLSEGMEINAALRAYEQITAPSNYQRPEATASPKMIEKAKQRLTDLGLIGSLDRRQLDGRDLTIDKCLYVHRPKVTVGDVFTEIAKEAPVDQKSLEKVEEITLEKFISDILPKTDSLKILFEHRHLGNLVTLTGPVLPEAPGLFKWNNPIAWSYTGGVADSIKEKVKAAGGRTDGWMRISLAWHNYDDLDLHFGIPGHKSLVYYGNKYDRELNARLDVDMNAGGGHTREPVENIDISSQLKPGTYMAMVHQFNKRETFKSGYQIQIEHGGVVQTLSSPKSPPEKGFHEVIKFTVTKDGTVAFEKSPLASFSSGMTKWGIKTGTWQTVKALTTSPNHWDGQKAGQKHWIFILDGCKSDETIRPFYNVMLRDDLHDEKKVFEMLANKVNVQPAEGAELSGLGFSEKGSFHVQVQGTFTRVLKVTF